MRGYAFNDEKVDESPLRLVDKPTSKKLKNEIKAACRVISFVWIISMAFISQAVIAPDVVADLFSVTLMAAASLQVIGR